MRSEHRIVRKDTTGNKALVWVHVQGRNEAWDCEVYGYCAFLYTMQGRHAETVFRQREKLFADALQGDLLDPPKPAQLTDGEIKTDDVQTSAQEAEVDEEETQAIEQQAVIDAMAQQQVKKWNTRSQPPRKKSFVNNW
jgi:phage terminase large subunit GpA-like protein